MAGNAPLTQDQKRNALMRALHSTAGAEQRWVHRAVQGLDDCQAEARRAALKAQQEAQRKARAEAAQHRKQEE